MSARRPDGTSYSDQPAHGRWPRRRVIASCIKTQGALLTRYYLIETRWFSVYLHHLHASDDGRALHDHPWSFLTFLLSGGYTEITPSGNRDGCQCQRFGKSAVPSPRTGECLICGCQARYNVATWRPRFSVLWRPAEWQHRIEVVRPVWTLLLHFPRRREWGFVTPGGWMDWRSYGRAFCD